MESIYINGKKFDYEKVSVYTGEYDENNALTMAIRFDVWLTTGLSYVESEYFGEYASLEELKTTVKEVLS